MSTIFLEGVGQLTAINPRPISISKIFVEKSLDIVSSCNYQSDKGRANLSRLKSIYQDILKLADSYNYLFNLIISN